MDLESKRCEVEPYRRNVTSVQPQLIAAREGAGLSVHDERFRHVDDDFPSFF